MSNPKTTDGFRKTLTETAPRPWRVEAPNKQYMRIVDGSGTCICDFFGIMQQLPPRRIRNTAADPQHYPVRHDEAVVCE